MNAPRCCATSSSIVARAVWNEEARGRGLPFYQRVSLFPGRFGKRLARWSESHGWRSRGACHGRANQNSEVRGLECGRGGCGARFHAEPFQDVFHVFRHGSRTYVQNNCNLAIGLTDCDVGQNF